MKYLICLIVGFAISLNLNGQEKTIIITEGSLPYEDQTWFTSGTNGEFPSDKIKKYWDEKKRIHAASHTNNGWFIVMAKNTGYTAQTYKRSAEWPTKWIKDNWDEDYYISEVTYGAGEWLIVMSKSDEFTGQSLNRGTWSEIKNWVKEKRDDGFHFTSAAHDGNEWAFVMSKYRPISSQGYFFADTYDEMKTKIKEKVWDQDYRIHLIEYGAGEYFVAYGLYAEDNDRGQSYVVNHENLKNYINEQWDKSRDIAYIGGGIVKSDNLSASNNSAITNNGNQGKSIRTDLPNGGYIDYNWDENGVLHTVTHQACIWCHGSKTCNICFGMGGVSYGGMWYPCKSCMGTKICQNCKGEGYTTSVGVVQPDGSGSMVSSNGYTVNSFGGGHVVTSPDGKVSVHGGSGSSSDNASSSSSRSSTSSSKTCPKCNGQKYEATAYTYAAASASGWMPPYHHTGGKCPYCNRVDDHYHYPCTECHGYGHIR